MYKGFRIFNMNPCGKNTLSTWAKFRGSSFFFSLTDSTHFQGCLGWQLIPPTHSTRLSHLYETFRSFCYILIFILEYSDILNDFLFAYIYSLFFLCGFWQKFDVLHSPLQYHTEYFHNPKKILCASPTQPSTLPISKALSNSDLLAFPESHITKIIQYAELQTWLL